MIIPACDIIDNKIVRLYQGNYDLINYYNDNIYTLLDNYFAAGVKIIHVVDLNAARNYKDAQKKFITKIIKYCHGHIQIAGGIRTERDIEYFLSLGVKRIVLGSVIIKNFDIFAKWVKDYGNECIVAALDIRIDNQNCKMVSINGWKKHTNILLETMLNKLSDINIKHVLCTDILKDGTLSGPNFALYKYLTMSFSRINFQSSGGISTLQDIKKLLKLGIKDIIIGKSLLEKKFTIVEALKCYRKGLFHASM